jgi:transposase-like protein
MSDDTTSAGSFEWTAQKLKAANLIAEDTMSKQRIAEEVGIGVALLKEWRDHPDFQRRVAEIVKELDEAVSQLRFAKRRGRIEALNDLAEDYVKIVKERAEYFTLNPVEDVPGLKTGRFSREEKSIGSGNLQKTVVVYTPDTALDKSFRDTLVQIARERGEWLDKRELSGPDGSSLLGIIEIEVTHPAGEFRDDEDDDE